MHFAYTALGTAAESREVSVNAQNKNETTATRLCGEQLTGLVVVAMPLGWTCMTNIYHFFEILIQTKTALGPSPLKWGTIPVPERIE